MIGGLRGDDGHAEAGLATLHGVELIGERSPLGQRHRLHAVSEHGHNLYIIAGRSVVGCIAGHAVGIQLRLCLILLGLAILANLRFAELVGQFARAEHRQLARVHRHQSIPLSAGHLAVVVFGELLHLAQGLDAACRRAQCLAVVVERLLAGNVSRLLCLQMLRGHIGSREDGIFDGCEVGVFQLRTNQLLNVLHQLAQLVVFTQIALQLVAEGKGIELRIARR